MPISPTFQVEKTYALNKISADLATYAADYPELKTVRENLAKVTLSWVQGSKKELVQIEAELKQINMAARNELLKFIETTHQTQQNRKLFKDILNALMLLAYYWPLNNYDVEEKDFVCPYTLCNWGEETNRIIFPTGSSIDKTSFQSYAQFCENHKKYIDPLSHRTLKLKDSTHDYLKAYSFEVSKTTNPAYTYNRNSSLEVVGAALRGFVRGLVRGLIYTMLVAAYTIIPPLPVLVIITGVAMLVCGIQSAVGSIQEKLAKFEAMEQPDNNLDVPATFETSLVAIRNEATNNPSSTLLMNQQLHLVPTPAKTTSWETIETIIDIAEPSIQPTESPTPEVASYTRRLG